MWPTMEQAWKGPEAPAEARGRHGCELPGQGQADSAREAVAGFPIGDLRPHFPRQLEREIYEHTPDGAEVPMAAHEHVGGPARHLSVKWIAARAGCSTEDARQLADRLAVLDVNERLAREICRWAYVRGTPATLAYLDPLCMAAAEAETCDPEDALEQGKADGVPETIAYHRVGEEDEGAPDWLSRRPWLEALCEELRNAPTMPELKALKKSIYDLPMPGTWASVAWSFAYAAEDRLQARARKARPNHAAALLARIAAAGKRELRCIGKAMYNLQAGKAKTHAKLDDHWSDLWEAYNARKAVLAATG